MGTVSAAPPPSFVPGVVVLLLIVLLIVRRTVRQVSGDRVSFSRLFGFAALYVLLFVALAGGTLYAAVGAWGPDAYGLVAGYVVVPVVAGSLAVPYVERIVRLEERSDGRWYYRLSWHVPVLYLVLFLVRVGAEVAIFGAAGTPFAYPPPAPPSVGALEVLVGVDLLFGASLGLLLGRGIGIYRARRAHRARAESGPPAANPRLPGG